MFNELDIVGLVVFVGQHQQKKSSFQTTILSDGNFLFMDIYYFDFIDDVSLSFFFKGNTYFGVKCWASLEEYALADVVVVGAFLAFSNLQWRAMDCKTGSKIRFAFIHEGTLVSSRSVHD